MRKWKLIVPVLFLSLCLVALPACDEEEAQAQRTKIVQKYNEAVASNDTVLADFYAQKLADADRKIAAVKTNTVANTAEAVKDNPLMTLVPEPIRSPIVLGIGLFASLWRMFKWKGAATSIAKSIEKLPETTVWSNDTTALTLDANQSPAAKVAVDLAQGKKVPLLDRLL